MVRVAVGVGTVVVVVVTPRAGKLERIIARYLTEQGYRVTCATPKTVWRGPRIRCKRCRRIHPTCGSIPRQAGSNDLFGCVDVLACRADSWPYWVAVQCGPSSQAARKRRELDAFPWPMDVELWVVVPDARKYAKPGDLRRWRTAVGSKTLEPWTDDVLDRNMLLEIRETP